MCVSAFVCVLVCSMGMGGGAQDCEGLFCEDSKMTQIRRFNALMDLQGVVVGTWGGGLGQMYVLFLKLLCKCDAKPTLRSLRKALCNLFWHLMGLI